MAEQPAPRVIGAGDAPSTHSTTQGIVAPLVANNNFEIKSGLISMVQSHKFHGLPMENPLEHLDQFDRLCELTKINGISEDGFKLRLFPFSLGDKASQWERALPQNSITTWDDCKKAFLLKFFSNSRTTKLKNDISSFTQRNNESFSEAWERFKMYTTQCPHHGFSKESLLCTLYRGASPKIRLHLDTASNGNFLNQDVTSGWDLVEKLAISDGNYNEDFDRTIRGSSTSATSNSKEIQALNDKLDKLLLTQQKQVHFVGESSSPQDPTVEDDQVEEILYIQNQAGFNRGFINYRSNPNLSYRNTNVANPQDQVYPTQQPAPNKTFVQNPPTNPPGFAPKPAPQSDSELKALLLQLLQGQNAATQDNTKRFTELRTHIDCSYDDLNHKLEILNSRLKHVESNSPSASTKSTGQLPGKAVQNPKDSANVYAVSTAPAIHLLPFKKRFSHITWDGDLQGGGASCHAAAVIAESTPLEQPTRVSDRVDFVSVEEKRILDLHAMITSPFPERFAEDIEKEYEIMLEEELLELEKSMTFDEAVEKLGPFGYGLRERTLKRIQDRRATAAKSQECQVIAQQEVLVQEKLEDPGSFTLPCSINNQAFGKALCDLGASVSIMPLSVAKRLGYHKFLPSMLSLVLADRTVRFPHGLLENVPVRIGKLEIPTDFIIMKMDEEPKDPLILGRPFLASSQVVIDAKTGEIILRATNGLVVRFNTSSRLESSTFEGQLYSVEEVDDEEMFERNYRLLGYRVNTRSRFQGVVQPFVTFAEDGTPNERMAQVTRLPDSSDHSSGITKDSTPLDRVTHSDASHHVLYSDTSHREVVPTPTTPHGADQGTLLALQSLVVELSLSVERLTLEVSKLKQIQISPEELNMKPKPPEMSQKFYNALRASSYHHSKPSLERSTLTLKDTFEA
ncbi:hypothetical protein V5N11_003467 [Cardamine amara subsp. amara]|uniref:Retrotransposon gag domain-containing protein n=1 Tax=Cardamine amara subsp. amara TaxID=228776 RepID=A0ABD1C266_CARAN